MLDTSQTLTDQSRWARYAIPLAGAWSLLYAVLGFFWALGRPGLPMGRGHDPAANLSILGQVDGPDVARGMAMLGLIGAVVAVAMYGSRGTRRASRFALPAFAWAAAFGLTMLLPDYRLLMTVA